MIVFSQSTCPRRFDFQEKNPIRSNIELHGNLNKKTNEPLYHEFQQFRKINTHEKPDTKRTVNPELAVRKSII
jgi:hypothetical protein